MKTNQNRLMHQWAISIAYLYVQNLTDENPEPRFLTFDTLCDLHPNLARARLSDRKIRYKVLSRLSDELQDFGFVVAERPIDLQGIVIAPIDSFAFAHHLEIDETKAAPSYTAKKIEVAERLGLNYDGEGEDED